MKRAVIGFIGLLLCASSQVYAQEKGPADITLQTAEAKKPAVFPHAIHQEAYDCSTCHHGMADGKKVPYKAGDTIAKCNSCHNSDVLAGVSYTPEGEKKALKLDTLKGAGHGRCLACHKAIKAQDPAKKALASCKTCHPKKK